MDSSQSAIAFPLGNLPVDIQKWVVLADRSSSLIFAQASKFFRKVILEHISNEFRKLFENSAGSDRRDEWDDIPKNIDSILNAMIIHSIPIDCAMHTFNWYLGDSYSGWTIEEVFATIVSTFEDIHRERKTLKHQVHVEWILDSTGVSRPTFITLPFASCAGKCDCDVNKSI